MPRLSMISRSQVVRLSFNCGLRSMHARRRAGRRGHNARRAAMRSRRALPSSLVLCTASQRTTVQLAIAEPCVARRGSELAAERRRRVCVGRPMLERVAQGVRQDRPWRVCVQERLCRCFRCRRRAVNDGSRNALPEVPSGRRLLATRPQRLVARHPPRILAIGGRLAIGVHLSCGPRRLPRFVGQHRSRLVCLAAAQD